MLTFTLPRVVANSGKELFFTAHTNLSNFSHSSSSTTGTHTVCDLLLGANWTVMGSALKSSPGVAEQLEAGEHSTVILNGELKFPTTFITKQAFSVYS